MAGTTAKPKEKVAILGGGVGGMVTAFWLTSTPELRERFDVTVYQLGWRLGGKGASGRNLAQGARIEEHGLHIWFGFYDNAFLTMRQCYEELGARPAGCPIPDFARAFTETSVIGLYEHYDQKWIPHRIDMPPRPSPVHPTLGQSGPLPSLWLLIARAIDWFLDTWEELRKELGLPDHEFPKTPVQRFLHWSSQFAVDLDFFDAGLRQRLLDAVQTLGADIGEVDRKSETAAQIVRVLGDLVLDPLVAFKDHLWKNVVASRQSHAELRLFFTTFDTFVTAAIGILRDGVLTQGFLAIDGQELRDFLRRHGAQPFTLDLDHSPFLRGWYDAAFAYRFENGAPVPALAAGTGVHGILRLVGSYRGHVAYKMQAGMGDTVFAPFYEVLRNRGVRFEFFRQVTDLKLDEDRTSVGSIVLKRQAEVIQDRAYQPLVDVHGLPCWPSGPDWSLLENGDHLRELGVDFEHGGSAPDARIQELQLGRDFDRVVLAIPAPALGPITGEIRRQVPRFDKMVTSSHSVMTQALQVWTTRELPSLGCEFGRDAIATSFVEPVDTYCDMSHLLVRERWDTDPPRGVAYFCGVMDDEVTQADADAAARRTVTDLLREHATDLWPAAKLADGSFDWSVLRDPSGATGPARLAAQYVRANFEPTERYVLSLPGTTSSRLPPDGLVRAAEGKLAGPGIRNLYLAGDWTLTGINGGCVEAATMSGMRAAQAIGGEPRVIACENNEWLQRIEQ